MGQRVLVNQSMNAREQGGRHSIKTKKKHEKKDDEVRSKHALEKLCI